MSSDARPGSPMVLGRPLSFWRAALACGLVASALAMLSSAPVSLRVPGILPLVFAGAALLIAAPARRFERHEVADAAIMALLAVGVLLPTLRGVFGLAPSPEAALFSQSMGPLLLGLLLVGWRFRQQDPHLLPLAVLFAGVLRFAFRDVDAAGVSAELPWWIAGTLWVTGVSLVSRHPATRGIDSAPLLAGLSWFVLSFGALTFGELASAHVALHPYDTRAGVEAWMAAPLFGWSAGSAATMWVEFSARYPGLGPFGPPGWARLLAEHGVVPIVLLVVAGLWSLVRTIGSRDWNVSRAMATGLFGFAMMALLTSRVDLRIALALVFLAWPSVLGQPRSRPDDTNPETAPPFAWGEWSIVLVLMMASAALPLAMVWHYHRQAPGETIHARSIVPHWARPWRDQAWLIRYRSEEMAQWTDPRRLLEPVAREWVRCAPHDELAHFELLRWAARSLEPREAERIARASHERLPWSPQVSLMLVRFLEGQDREADALAFLEQEARLRGPLHPSLTERRLTLQRTLRARQRENPDAS